MESFIDKHTQKDKFIVLTTGIAGGWKPDKPGVDAITSASALDKREQIARSIVDNSWFSLRTYKMLMREGRNLPLSEALDYERKNSPGMGPDTIERLEAFFKAK